MFGLPKKTLPVSQLTSLKQMQHYDVHNFNQKKGKEKNKEENIQFTNFSNTCNLTNTFESAHGNVMYIEHYY